MLSLAEKKDKVIRATDLDALSCRLNCNEKGYYTPPDPYISVLVSSYSKYLQFCQGYTNLSSSRTFRQAFGEKKFPLINRGTYFRTQLITSVVREFVNKYETCQIVSMGGGSDTRCFEFLLDLSVKYVEIDFPETTKIKRLAIKLNPNLCKIVNTELENDTIETKDQFDAAKTDLHTSNYHLMGYDLRQLDNSSKILSAIDATIPTLILSECVLCYSNPEENKKIISFWQEYFKSTLMALLVYEPISLNDSFGSQMSENLQKRGINLLTFNEYPTPKSKVEFLKSLGMKNVRVADLSDVGGYGNSGSWFTDKELTRINRLELIDEVEEIKLLLLHYCLLYGENESELTFDSINSKAWKSL